MEIIARALQRAKSTPQLGGIGGLPVQPERVALVGEEQENAAVRLLPSTMLAARIVAYDTNHMATRPYDVLRNQLQSLVQDDRNGLVAVTAPTVGCGTTTVAANLAFSFARTPSANVLLVDANAGASSIMAMMGFPLKGPPGKMERPELILAEVGGTQIHVFCPGNSYEKTSGKSDAMQLLRRIDALRRALNPTITILDLPPMLSADESAALASEAQAVVLLLSVGQSRLAELEACRTYLGTRSNVQVVLNKCRKHGL